MKRLSLLTLPLVLAACSQPSPDASSGAAAAPTTAPAPASEAAPDATATLSTHRWRLDAAVDAQGRRIDALFARADRPLQLDFAGGRVVVDNACNHIGGRYAVVGNRLDIGRLESTLMACADSKLMALDREIGRRLEGSSPFTLSDGGTPRLTLTTTAGDVLTFVGTPTAATRFDGPGETVFLEVAAQTRPCPHPLIANKQCLQVREVRYDEQGIRTGAPGDWQPLYQDIEGYEHHDDVRNVLRVKRYEVKNPPADAPSVAYVLDTVVESEAVR